MRAPFSDRRVREALSMAIDREAITDKVFKTGEIPAYSFVPPGTGNYGEPAWVPWKDLPQAERVARAKALLAEVGFGPAKPLQVTLKYNTSENHKKIAIAVAAMWKQLGVATEILNSEVKVHYNQLEENDFDVARTGWIADHDDPENVLSLLATATGKQNYGRYSNAEFDRLMDEAARTADLEKRAELLRRAEATALADTATIPIHYYVSKNLVSPKVKGWVANTKDIHRTRWLSVGGWGDGAVRNLVLPVTALALPQIAYIARLTRGSMIEALGQNHVRTARAKGLGERIVVVRHALRGGLLPVVSYLGPATAGLVTGSVVIETIFAIPGIGRYFVQGALNRDHTLVMGVVIFYAVLIILLNLVVDLLYGLLDRRVKHG